MRSKLCVASPPSGSIRLPKWCIMNKDFDCVEMKRRAQERILERLRGMTREQELAYWAEESRKLRELQQQPRSDQKKSA